MGETITAAEANRKFSRLLRNVREGGSFVITSHGNPVARLSPVDEKSENRDARTALLERLRAQPAVDVGRWERDSLYERSR